MPPCQHQRSERALCDDAQVVADLGSLQLGNVVRWLGSGGGDAAGDALRDPSAVLLDTMTLTMRGLGAKVDAEGHNGDNIVREYDEGTQVARTPLQYQRGSATLQSPSVYPSIRPVLGRSGMGACRYLSDRSCQLRCPCPPEHLPRAIG